MKIDRYMILRTVWLLCIAMAVAGCKEELSSLAEDDGEIRAGDPVMFTTYTPSAVKTRATAEETFNEEHKYKVVSADYRFKVEMYAEGEVLKGTGYYQPKTTETTAGDPPVTNKIYAEDGTLRVQENMAGLYWPDNVNRYGFKAIAGTDALEADQSDAEKLFANDRLEGYGFVVPASESDYGGGYNENKLNYFNAKEWKGKNVAIGLDTEDNYKKIPLYLQHKRSLVTVKLKAGEGVTREALKELANIETLIYSYSGDTKTEIKAFGENGENVTVDYDPDQKDFGERATGVPTSQYTAIVEPHDYQAGAETDVIAEVRLSGQRFTFYASSDWLYNSAKSPENTEAVEHMKKYNLAAGKHLVITATLGRGSRKIVITAYVEDWTDVQMASVVDDFGQTGNPIQIMNRQTLYEFLTGPNNKAGTVALIVPGSIDLEEGGEWVPQPLKCTLNMAGATFKTKHMVFSEISSSGHLVNGKVSVEDAVTVDAMVATTNDGSIEHIDVTLNNAGAKATRGGLVVTNHGSILNCSSQLPVSGSGSSIVGGIAAESLSAGSSLPVIDGCSVDARVDGESGCKGGGIVGKAVGRVTNNTFDYGITLLQNSSDFENIIYDKAEGNAVLRAYNNAWPTTATNTIGTATTSENVNVMSGVRYDAIIDSQAELAKLLDSEHNQSTKKYRIAKDFTVSKETWNYGKKADIDNSSGSTSNVHFELNGNNKTIYTDAMLFSIIRNDIYDLNINLSGNMIVNDNDGVMAPLAYAVHGTDTKISNIQVRAGDYTIQAATAAGLVVWAYGGATIENCQSKAKILVSSGTLSEDAKRYSGGIVACAEVATITRCIYHNVNGTLTDVSGSTHTGLYYGGILGGTTQKNVTDGTDPKVTITDCTSWYSPTSNHDNNNQKGSIVGYAQNKKGDVLENCLSDCQGNYWPEGSQAVGSWLTSMTLEQVIGKRNAVKPIEGSY